MANVYCRFKNVGRGKVVKFCIGGKENPKRIKQARTANRMRSGGESSRPPPYPRGRYGNRGLKADRPVGQVRKVGKGKYVKRRTVPKGRPMGRFRTRGVKRKSKYTRTMRARRKQTAAAIRNRKNVAKARAIARAGDRRARIKRRFQNIAKRLRRARGRKVRRKAIKARKAYSKKVLMRKVKASKTINALIRARQARKKVSAMRAARANTAQSRIASMIRGRITRNRVRDANRLGLTGSRRKLMVARGKLRIKRKKKGKKGGKK